MELKPDWPKGYSRLGAAYHGLEDWDDAIKAYEDGEPSRPASHNNDRHAQPVHAAPCSHHRTSGVACSTEVCKHPNKATAARTQIQWAPCQTVLFAGLKLDSSNQQLQKALQDAQEAKEQPSLGGDGGLFGAQAIAKLAMDPRTRPFLQQPDFMAMIKALQVWCTAYTLWIKQLH